MSLKQKQLASILFTLVVYAAIIGLKGALVVMVAIGFHESCHLWAAKKMGLETRGFFMMPFMGGVALVAGKYKTLAQQAFVVLAGPVGGGLLALAVAGVYFLTHWPFLAGVAILMLYVNMFNLIPLSFMDGGQLLDTIAYSINRTFGMVLHITSAVIAPFVLWFYNPVLTLLVGLMGLKGIQTEINNWKAYKSKKYYLCTDEYLYPPKRMSNQQILGTVASWIGAFGIMFVVYHLIMSIPGNSLALVFSR